jgi:hypothetical protein
MDVCLQERVVSGTKLKNNSVGGIVNIRENYLEDVKAFIKRARELIDQTQDRGERENRHCSFTMLLQACTYMNTEEFTSEVKLTLPASKNPTLQKIEEKLLEINCVCQDAFSDKHELYNSINKSPNFKNLKKAFISNVKDTIAELAGINEIYQFSSNKL